MSGRSWWTSLRPSLLEHGDENGAGVAHIMARNTLAEYLARTPIPGSETSLVRCASEHTVGMGEVEIRRALAQELRVGADRKKWRNRLSTGSDGEVLQRYRTPGESPPQRSEFENPAVMRRFWRRWSTHRADNLGLFVCSPARHERTDCILAFQLLDCFPCRLENFQIEAFTPNEHSHRA